LKDKGGLPRPRSMATGGQGAPRSTRKTLNRAPGLKRASSAKRYLRRNKKKKKKKKKTKKKKKKNFSCKEKLFCLKGTMCRPKAQRSLPGGLATTKKNRSCPPKGDRVPEKKEKRFPQGPPIEEPGPVGEKEGPLPRTRKSSFEERRETFQLFPDRYFKKRAGQLPRVKKKIYDKAV